MREDDIASRLSLLSMKKKVDTNFYENFGIASHSIIKQPSIPIQVIFSHLYLSEPDPSFRLSTTDLFPSPRTSLFQIFKMIAKLFTLAAVIALATAAPVSTCKTNLDPQLTLLMVDKLASEIATKRDPANDLIEYYIDGPSENDKKRDVKMRRDPENDLVVFYIPEESKTTKRDVLTKRDSENELVEFYVGEESETAKRDVKVRRDPENDLVVFYIPEESKTTKRDSENELVKFYVGKEDVDKRSNNGLPVYSSVDADSKGLRRRDSENELVKFYVGAESTEKRNNDAV